MSQGAGYWSERRVVVTGGGGFLGSYVVERLRQRGARHVLTPTRAEYDLRRLEAVEETNTPCGLARKMLLVQGQAYRQLYGLGLERTVHWCEAQRKGTVAPYAY